MSLQMPEPDPQPRSAAGPAGDAQAETEHADLVRRASLGEAAAWEELVRVFARRVYAAAKSRLGDADAAEEVTQSVMATIYETISSGRYIERGSFESWLFRIAMNRVRDAGRRRSRDRRLASGYRSERSAGVGAGSGAEPIGTQHLEAVRWAITKLPEADQEIVSLRHHAGLSFAQIAETLESPLGTVLARHHRALNKLRTLLMPQAEETRS